VRCKSYAQPHERPRPFGVPAARHGSTKRVSHLGGAARLQGAWAQPAPIPDARPVTQMDSTATTTADVRRQPLSISSLVSPLLHDGLAKVKDAILDTPLALAVPAFQAALRGMQR
jgi:hypothetical protein